MKAKFIGLIVVFFVVSATAFTFLSKVDENDFDIVCSSFKELSKEGDVDALSHEERVAYITKKLDQKLTADDNAYEAWMATSSAVEGQRYMLFKMAADSTGYESWSCEEMRSLIEPSSE
ncbi:hypothetical protein EUZ85_29905 [Hahella sp. KA22]|uniref:hypothetical protein n=1 Tax=Hahella sp. KA22 TaxID=1628392 RepID=UPI000FDE1899|nr:hypothetical protein [Hahella sp. KA22]AZZ94700.1 hypothetical protein ENC22_27320 [Hahella sp. KA22]QAY58073.1 hypothetical protein EUZ85_29905 [Hahella sp. KA22]